MLAFLFSWPLYFIPMTAGFLGFKSNKKSFKTSIVFGFISIFVARFQFNEFGSMAVLYSMIGSTAGFFGAHYWQFPHELNDFQKKLVEKFKNYIKNIIATPKRLIHRLTYFSIFSQNNNHNYFFGFTFFFILLNVPIFMFGLTEANNELMFIRIMASVLCILMCLSEMWLTSKAREIFTYTVITFCLPILGVYYYLVSGHELIWLVNMVVSIILFFVLMPRGYSLLFGAIGVILGYGLYLYHGELYVYNNHLPTGQYSAFMLSTLLLCTLYYINLQSKREKKSLQTLGHSIAHDVGAPLSLGIISTEMIETALKNKDYTKMQEYLALQKESQNKAMHDLKVMVSAMSTNTQKKPSDWGKYSISESIHEALRHHYMLEKERERVTFVASDDFTYTGSLTIFRHLLSNLLVNAFKYAGAYAEIEIRINKDRRSLHFKDDGCGMPAAIKDDIFMKYATTNGNGIGLSFCKEVMHLMLGEIECISEEGKGTEFVMIFPS
jgi:signal transduction histidine kinase